MKKTRKLKYPYQRMPEKKALTEEILMDIKDITGFAKRDIKEVINTYCKVIAKHMCEKKSITIPELGIIYPMIKPGKNVVRMNNFSEKDPELMYMEDRWVCRFKVGKGLKESLLKMPLSKEEIENIYME